MKTEITVTANGVYTHYSPEPAPSTAAFVKEPHTVLTHIRYDEQPVVSGATALEREQSFDKIVNQPKHGKMHINITMLKDIVDHLYQATDGDGIFHLDTFEYETKQGLAIGLRFTEYDKENPRQAALLPYYIPSED